MTFNFIQAEFDLWAPHYDTDAMGRNHYAAHEMVAQKIARFSAPENTPRIVDLGIGTGLTAGKLRSYFSSAHITGYDLSPKMLRECAGKKIADELVEYDLGRDSWPIEQSSADIVSCAGLLEFIDDPGRFLVNTHMIMKPGAVAALTFEVLKPTLKQTALPTGRPNNRYRMEEMCALAEQADLDVIDHEEFDGYQIYGRTVTYGALTLQR
jgi:predicted TPR repeat methyltransferase